MENLVVAGSNFALLIPLWSSMGAKDGLTAALILLLALFSVASHLVETPRHGMPGYFPGHPRLFRWLNYGDVMSCFLLVARLLYLFWGRPSSSWLVLGALGWPIVLMIWSGRTKHKLIYILVHSSWHIAIFVSLHLFLTWFIYN